MVTKNCEYCEGEYEGTYSSKYCGDICKNLAALERQTGFHVVAEQICDGRCCQRARKNLHKRPQGWIFVQQRDYMMKKGILIEFCPFCRGKLE